MDDKTPPLEVKEWSHYLKATKAKRPAKGFEVVLATLHLDPKVARSLELRRQGSRVELVAHLKEAKRFYPPVVKSVSPKIKRTMFVEPEGMRPRHLDFRALPALLPKSLALPGRVRSRDLTSRKNSGLPTSLFLPDDRVTFNDTAFPWSTCGRVDTAAGSGSGVMIGPRHLLTASHVVNWGANNTAGWLKFAPLRFDDNEPFGHAYATAIYSWNKANGSDGIDALECAFDYVVCVLDSRIGDTTGWMGARGYSTSWDGKDYWGHVGYPGDLSSGKRPAFVGFQAMDSTFTQSTGGRDSFGIKHKIDVIPGQSGGPYFGFWEGEPWPRVVATQSAEKWGGSSGPNTSGGGDPLPELINLARNAAP